MDKTKEIINVVTAIKNLKMKLRQLVYDMTMDKNEEATTRPVGRPRKALYQRKVKYQQVSPAKHHRKFTSEEDKEIIDGIEGATALARKFNRVPSSIYRRRELLIKKGLMK